MNTAVIFFSIFVTARVVKYTYAVGNLTSIPEAINGVLTACPGDGISLTCIHDNVGVQSTRWVLPGAAVCIIPHDGTFPDCGPFTLTMVSDRSGPTLSSTVWVAASDTLNGSTLECFDGTSTTPPPVGTVNISVLSIPTPNIAAVNQISQSSVSVNLTVDGNLQCAATYVVNATQQGGTGVVFGGSNSVTQVQVTGLDVCSYSYSFVGNVVTAGEVSGAMSSPPVNFTADLSVIDGVSNVRNNMLNTALEWEQLANPDYPTCITSYSLQFNGMTYNTTTNSTVVTRDQLNGTGFPFCTTTPVTVTPVTGMGLLSPGAASGNILLFPDIYLLISGFYFLNGTSSDMTIEMNRTNVTEIMESITFAGMVQSTSQVEFPDRMFGYSRSGMTCSPNTNFTGDSFRATLPADANSGDNFTMCVQLRLENCTITASADFTIPGRNITETAQEITNDTACINVSTAITECLPDELQVRVLLNSSVIIYSGPFPNSYQLKLQLIGLTPDTYYEYTVEVFKLINQVVISSATFSFTTAPSPTTPPPTTMTTTPTMTTITSDGTSPSPTPAPGGCDTGCIVGVIVGIVLLVLLLIGATLIAFCYWRYTKKVGKAKISSHEMETQSKPLTDNNGEGASRAESPTSRTSKDPDPAQTGDSGAAESAALIYADLDMAKGKKPKSQDTTTGATGAESEPVVYASIDATKTEAAKSAAETTATTSD